MNHLLISTILLVSLFIVAFLLVMANRNSRRNPEYFDSNSNVNTVVDANQNAYLPNKLACEDITKILEFKYVYIGDSNGNSLSFDYSGTQSNVYMEKLANPVKWEIVPHTLSDYNQCLIEIRSYVKPNFYLEGHRDGSLGMSLFGGSNTQLWRLISTDKATNSYQIKSYLTGKSLVITGRPYIKRNTAMVELGDAGSQWRLVGAGINNNMVKFMNNQKRVVPFIPTLDVEDGPTKEDIKLKQGRYVWRPEYAVIWDGTYNVAPGDVGHKDYSVEIEVERDGTGNITVSSPLAKSKWPVRAYGANIMKGQSVFAEMMADKRVRLTVSLDSSDNNIQTYNLIKAN